MLGMVKVQKWIHCFIAVLLYSSKCLICLERRKDNQEGSYLVLMPNTDYLRAAGFEKLLKRKYTFI